MLLIGGAAVAGVLIYNRVQERASRRDAERAFGAKHADMLVEPPVQVRREPTLNPARSTAQSALDPKVDYIMELDGVAAGALRNDWAAVERRFARRVTLADEHGKACAGLQMVSRKGVTTEADLLEFRSQVESIAAKYSASVSAPEMRAALEAAHALDRACADVDVQIALHVLGVPDPGLKDQPFQSARRADGVTLLLDVPRTPDLARSYDAMVRAARQLGGRIVDDNGNALDERALAAIGVEVESLHARLAELHIEPGSPLALRLFS